MISKVGETRVMQRSGQILFPPEACIAGTRTVAAGLSLWRDGKTVVLVSELRPWP